jgi:hypothetical protein
VSFVEETARDGFSEREAMFLSKFEHAAHRFLSLRPLSCVWRCLSDRFLGEGKEIRLQKHAAGLRTRQETRFNFGPQMKSNGHGYLSFEFTPTAQAGLVA